MAKDYRLTIKKRGRRFRLPLFLLSIEMISTAADFQPIISVFDAGDYSFKIVSELAETKFKVSVAEESGGCGSSLVACGPIV